MKVAKNYVAWHYKTDATEIVELVIDELNDMLKKNNIKINYQYNRNHPANKEDGWDYFLELEKEKI